MERRSLGRTGIDVGVIGLGTWRTFDISPQDDEAMATRLAVVRACVEAGTNLFDSSPMYGRAEEVLSRALGDERPKVVIATKVWTADPDEARRQIDRALRFYRDCIDLYQVHNLVGWERYLPLLRGLREEGRVRAIGVTHYAHSAFPAIMRIIEREGIDAVQIPYDATDARAATELLPLAADAGIGVLTMSPFRTGDLTRTEPPQPELEPLRQYGVRTWAQALLKWVVSDPRVTATIPATSRPERARENAEAGEEPLLPEDERERVAWLARRMVS